MMKRTVSILAAALLTASIFPAAVPSAAQSNRILVSDTASLLTALQNVKAGDEIILRPGIYQADASSGLWRPFQAEADGTPDQHIILRSEDAQNPAVISGSTTESKCALYITGSYWEIRDLKISTACKGIFLAKSEHSIIYGCEVSDIGEEAIHIIDNSSYNLVENCVIHNTGKKTPKYGEGVYIGSAKNATEYGFDCHCNTVRGCKFGPNITADHVDIKEFTRGNLVEYCTFDGTGISGENGGDSFVEIKGNDTVVRYNTGRRSGCEKQLYGFDLSEQLEGWGQNNKIYDNTLYLDTADCYIVKGWKCAAEVFRNKTEPAECTYYGNRILQVREYLLSGDVSEDGQLDETDASFLQRWLATDTVPHISPENSDLNRDGILNAADLTLMKRKLLKGDTDEKAVISVDFVKEEAGKWRMTDGLGNKTVTFRIAADPGAKLNMAWGYWDPSLINPDTGKEGKWNQISLGTVTPDENGIADITVELPEDAARTALEVYTYADASGKRDPDEVSLLRVTV